MCCPAQKVAYGDGKTSDLVLDCCGTTNFKNSFVYLGYFYNHIMNCLEQKPEGKPWGQSARARYNPSWIRA